MAKAKTEKLGDVKAKNAAPAKNEPNVNRAPARKHANAARPKREVFKIGGDFDVEKREGFQRAWPTNRVNEIEKMQRRGWEIVTNENGDPITRVAGNGLTHYLMEIPQEDYDAEQDALHRENVERTRGIAAPKRELGQYVPKDSDNGFSPDAAYMREISTRGQHNDE